MYGLGIRGEGTRLTILSAQEDAPKADIILFQVSLKTATLLCMPLDNQITTTHQVEETTMLQIHIKAPINLPTMDTILPMIRPPLTSIRLYTNPGDRGGKRRREDGKRLAAPPNPIGMQEENLAGMKDIAGKMRMEVVRERLTVLCSLLATSVLCKLMTKRMKRLTKLHLLVVWRFLLLSVLMPNPCLIMGTIRKPLWKRWFDRETRNY